MQTNLNWCYGENLLVDGDFGPLTSAALKRAQAEEGILVDGWYGNEARDNLLIVSLGMGGGANVCFYY